MTSDPPSHPSDPAHQVQLAQQARDQAQARARRWQRLYETEAEQRRQEAKAADQTIYDLRLEIQQLCQLSPSTSHSSPSRVRDTANPSAARIPPDLQNYIDALVAERNQLQQTLREEQNSHAKTRENLISALGDALDSQPKRPWSIPSSEMGARAGAIILKDRKGRANQSQ
ncbi:MAG: hypothetical protein HC934_04830 [Acaryochloridaceae cyanobacterium SU_2_1]|nr:hypothetical protein [Acaryochloridaceae cyanobacterium SU_2_1]NJM95018.1 hypothetical protein [Acaryochloridaceae cyanobacterium CSU_5_19]